MLKTDFDRTVKINALKQINFNGTNFNAQLTQRKFSVWPVA